MDRTTVFSKTEKGEIEAAGKTSAMSRDMRTLLMAIDGKATVGEVQAKFGKVPEAKLEQALQLLAKNGFIREFVPAAQAAAPPRSRAEGDIDLDFTVAIPTLSTIAKKAEEAARVQAETAAAAAAAARAKAQAEAKAKARAEAESRARAEQEARVRAEAEARAKRDAEQRARREAEEKAQKEAGLAERDELEMFLEARERQEAEGISGQKAEEPGRREAQERAKAQEQQRIEVEEKARLEAERRAREEAERKAQEHAEREREAAEERARVKAEEKARLEAERRAREEAERKAQEDAEREREAAEERARAEAEERARLEAERRAREEAERKAQEDAEREREAAEERARAEAEEKARLEAERRAREEAERKAQEAAEREREAAEERARAEAEEKARREEERRAREEAERKAQEDAERERKAAEERARAEAEEKARREAERRAREEAERAAQETAQREQAEEKARREAEEQALLQEPAKSGPSLDDLVNVETDFESVLRAGGGAKQEAAKVSTSADDAMLQEAEAIAGREAEGQARDKAALEGERKAAEAEVGRVEDERRGEGEGEQEHGADYAPDDATVSEREYAAALAQLEAEKEETERHFAEMAKELEAEEAALQEQRTAFEQLPDAGKWTKDETRESVRAEAAMHAEEAKAAAEEVPPVYRTPINWGKPVAVGLFLLLIIGLGLIHVVSFDGFIPQLEKLAGAHLQQPVKIKALHLSLVPMPYWRMDGVSAGNEGQFAADRINAVAELGSMFSDQKAFTSIELVSPVLSEKGLLALLFGKPQGQDFKVASISVKSGKLNSKTIVLPALDAKISIGEDGAWKKIVLETPDRKTSLLLEPKGEGAQLEVQTNVFSTPFGPAFLLENFSAKGTVFRDQLRLSEFKGGILGGYLSGSVNLKWGADWSLGGELGARAMDPGRIVPALIEEGMLEGKAVYAMRAKSYDELFAAPHLEGTFSVQKGWLLGVDLARLLQGGGVGGKTAFTEFSGNFVRDGAKTRLQQLRLSVGPVSASGSAEADGRKHIGGRFSVELKSPVAHARANLALSGTPTEPRFSH